MTMLENYTYEEITVGQTTSYSKTLTEQDILLFAAVSGDTNPVHLDEEFAATTIFNERIAHGMWTGGLISAAIALQLPGPGSIYLNQSLSFRAPAKLGDTITIKLEVTHKQDKRKTVTLACDAVNQQGTLVAQGTADVMAPRDKLSVPSPELPAIRVGDLSACREA